MTTVEPVLTTRNASLRDMATLLQRQQADKVDLVVPGRNMRLRGGVLEIDGIGAPTISLDGVTSATGRFRPTATCDGGLDWKGDTIALLGQLGAARGVQAGAGHVRAESGRRVFAGPARVRTLSPYVLTASAQEPTIATVTAPLDWPLWSSQ